MDLECPNINLVYKAKQIMDDVGRDYKKSKNFDQHRSFLKQGLIIAILVNLTNIQ